jgi:hypothetical protein
VLLLVVAATVRPLSPARGRAAATRQVFGDYPHPPDSGLLKGSSLIRCHHLLKTFWGWRDRQLPDGPVIWKSPTGKTYETRHRQPIFFPACDTTTAALPQQWVPVAQDGDRGVMMPKRQHTRAADRTRRILEERALSDAHVAEREQTTSVPRTKAKFTRREGRT